MRIQRACCSLSNWLIQLEQVTSDMTVDARLSVILSLPRNYSILENRRIPPCIRGRALDLTLIVSIPR